MAQRGVVLDATEMGPTTMQSPAALLSALAGPSGLPASYRPYTALTPQLLANVGPGNLEQFITQQLGQQNPQLNESQVGGRLGTLPRITAPANAATTLQDVMAQYLPARNQYNQGEIQPYLSPRPAPEGGGANMALGSAMALAPYTQGGMATLLGPDAYRLYAQGIGLESIPLALEAERYQKFVAEGGLL